jgi:hypothetical protein
MVEQQRAGSSLAGTGSTVMVASALQAMAVPLNVGLGDVTRYVGRWGGGDRRVGIYWTKGRNSQAHGVMGC